MPLYKLQRPLRETLELIEEKDLPEEERLRRQVIRVAIFLYNLTFSSWRP